MGICLLNNCQENFIFPKSAIKISTPKSQSYLSHEVLKTKESNSTLSTNKALNIMLDFKPNSINPFKPGKMSPEIKRNTPIINYLDKRKRSFSPTHFRNFGLKQKIENRE